MSLININNSRSIEIRVRSIQLNSASHGGRFIEPNATFNEIGGALLELTHGSARAQAVREGQGLLNALLLTDRSLYSLQSVLNSDEWEAMRIDVQVEAEVRHTGHGDINFSETQHIILLVKTTWQDQQD